MFGMSVFRITVFGMSECTRAVAADGGCWMANGISILREQQDVICRQQQPRPFAQLSTKQWSREGTNSHPRGQMGARPISGLAVGEEFAGSLDIQAALELDTRGS